MIVFDLQGRVLDINKVGLEKLEYTRKEIAFANISQIMPRQDDRERIVEELQKGRKVVNSEAVYQTKAGHEAPALFSGAPVRDRGGDIVAYLSLVREL